MVDGSTRIGAFVRITPAALIAPGLVATSVFAFITRSWNGSSSSRTRSSTAGRSQTITVWLSYLYGGDRFIDWGRDHGRLDG